VKVILFGGPLDGRQIEVEAPTEPPPPDTEPRMRLRLPDPMAPGDMVIYQLTNRMKGERFIFQILQGPGC
jgi:hypothetical protein